MIFLRRFRIPSKTTVSKSRFGAPPPPYSPSFFSSSAQQNSHTQAHPLTDEDLSKLKHLIPRLCHSDDPHHPPSDHLPTALRLTAADLLANPPLHSLPLSPLIQSLTSHPDTAPTMSLLTRLRHAPQSHRHIGPIALMLIKSYFEGRKCKPALAVFRWLRRPDSPCPPGGEVYGVVIEGLCRNGFLYEGLVAMRNMVIAVVGGEKLVPCCGSREWVYRGLLREARVMEAVELNDALLGFERGGHGGGDCEEARERVLKVLERVIDGWSE